MRYITNRDINIIQNNKTIKVCHRFNGNYIIFDENNTNIANLILQGASMTKTLKFIQKNYNSNKIESLKLRNLILYQ